MGKRENTKIVVDGFKAEPPLSDDEILQKLFEEGGVAFTDLRTVFNDIVKEKELRLSNKERKLKTIELLADVTEVPDADTMLKLVAMLQTKLKVASTKAMGSLRTWAKDKGIALPKVKKESKPRKVGFGGNIEKILNHILELRESFEPTDETPEFVADKKAVVAFCHKEGIPEAYSTNALNAVHFAKRWNGEIKDEAEVTDSAE